MYVARIPNRGSPPAILLRESYRQGGKVKNRTLANLSIALRGLEARLVAVLQRFGGYGDRFAAALAQVDRGQRRYVDEPGLDSAHTVWFQLHEDLLAPRDLSR
jgi:hypothetical protein